MKKFQQNVSRELRRAYPDRRRLECQCLSAISFVKNEPDMLDSPIWVLIINVVAMDMLKSKLPPSKLFSVELCFFNSINVLIVRWWLAYIIVLSYIFVLFRFLTHKIYKIWIINRLCNGLSRGVVSPLFKDIRYFPNLFIILIIKIISTIFTLGVSLSSYDIDKSLFFNILNEMTITWLLNSNHWLCIPNSKVDGCVIYDNDINWKNKFLFSEASWNCDPELAMFLFSLTTNLRIN